jgi:hypothetical protein
MMRHRIEKELKVDSRRIDSDSTVDMVFHLKWKCDDAAHTDGYQASRINAGRDYTLPSLLAGINGKQAGERFELQPCYLLR